MPRNYETRQEAEARRARVERARGLWKLHVPEREDKADDAG